LSLITNNAGAFSAYGPIWEVDPADWRRDVETNVFGTFNCCRTALPGMIARGRGRVIVMAGCGTATSFLMGFHAATSALELCSGLIGLLGASDWCFCTVAITRWWRSDIPL
jgi:NADP-dependent 3-hydroxy acid dehydrogenase YdfG